MAVTVTVTELPVTVTELPKGGNMRKALIIAIAATAVPAQASISEHDLRGLIGYTLVTSKTVKGYVKGAKIEESFEGCDYDRVIAFTDGTGLRCQSYSYSYAYRPEAFIFTRGSSIKMIVDGEVYEMTSL
jgi:hypothetical protein